MLCCARKRSARKSEDQPVVCASPACHIKSWSGNGTSVVLSALDIRVLEAVLLSVLHEIGLSICVQRMAVRPNMRELGPSWSA